MDGRFVALVAGRSRPCLVVGVRVLRCALNKNIDAVKMCQRLSGWSYVPKTASDAMVLPVVTSVDCEVCVSGGGWRWRLEEGRRGQRTP
jgi:hypothetical protein